MTAETETSDDELVQRCRSGDAAAWNLLVRRYQRLVFTVPRRAGLSEHEAADVFQMAFSKLFEHLNRLDDPSRLRAWLVTTAKRETLRLLHLARREVDLTPTDAEADDGSDPFDRLESPEPLPDAWLSDLQQQDRVRRAVARLDERSRRFVELLFLQEEPLSYADIASRLGISEGSIGPTRARCLAKLRTILQSS